MRALASVATHQGHQVFVIDADERKNIDRWSTLLDRFGNKPENLEIVAVSSPTEILALAQEQDRQGKLIIIDTEGQDQRRADCCAFCRRHSRGAGASCDGRYYRGSSARPQTHKLRYRFVTSSDSRLLLEA
ncbi:hypothetical protein ACG873_01335 (plasmid) [Mesorhizobium sp. AaZ16]|uniref:hypothetical protein n=1 Tax=Mesorhizobium sp. AaZ16 TaxID=3402289 RepID=UPI00374ED189